MLVGGCPRGVLAVQGCSLGIVVVVPGNSGNTSGYGLGVGCVLGGRGVSRIPQAPYQGKHLGRGLYFCFRRAR